MTQSISAQHLISCLQEKEKYKGTMIYLQEINKFNEKVYDIINVGLESILLQKHQNYMAKLLALRLFKEIVVTGNFTLIDGLNEKIEEEIFKVAQFNKKSKEINRGANYFIEMENLKKDTEIQKIGSSYVLIASEIIVALSRWYPVDEEGDETRFAQVYQDLMKAGVSLPKGNQLNFFKKDDQQKFKKNYAKWLKWYIENVKQEEIEETAKQLKSPDPSGKIITKQSNTDKDEKIEDKPFVSNIPEIKVTEMKKDQEQVQELPKKVQKLQKEESVDKKPEKKEKQYLLLIESLKQTVLSLQKEVNQIKAKNENQIQMIFNEREEKEKVQQQKVNLDKSMKEIAKKLSELELEKINMKEVLESNAHKIQELSCLNTELYQRIGFLERERQANKQSVKEVLPNKQNSEPQIYNIKVSPPRQYQDLEQQNQILNSALQNAEIHYKQLQRSYEDQIFDIKQEKKTLADNLRKKEQELQDLKKKKSVQQEFIQNIIREDSLMIEDQPKMSYKARPLENTLNQQQIPKSQIIKNCSVSEYLKSNTKMTVTENVYPIQPRRRSLKKTESHKGLQGTKQIQGFSKTGFDFQSKTSSNKLNKTGNNFFKKGQIQSNTNVVTFYPYLSDYFKSVPSENPHFKQFCLHLEDEKGIFFENETIKAELRRQNESGYILTLYNKSHLQLKMKVLSGHYSFIIDGEKSRKIGVKSSGDFKIKIQQLDLNLRYPVISVIIGNQIISLSSSIPQDRTIHLPLPLTLLDFCTIHPQKDETWVSSGKIGKISSNEVMISKINASLDRCFPYFKISHSRDRILAKAGLQIQGMQDARVLVELEQIQGQVIMGICFGSDCPNSCNFGKVIMQVLLFLIQQ